MREEKGGAVPGVLWAHRVTTCLAVALGLVFLLGIARTPEAQQVPSPASSGIASLQARIAELDLQVGYLKDRKNILDTSMRYVRGADRHDKDLVRSAFWPDASVSYGTPMARDAFVDWDERRLSEYAAHQHHVTGQTAEIQGNTAHVESYVIYFLVPRDRGADAPGAARPGRALTSEKTRVGSGRYVERWEKRDGEWKILVREYVEDLALLGGTVDYCAARECLGSWDRNDPSYLRPLQPLTAEERNARSAARRGTRSPEARRSIPDAVAGDRR